MGKFFLLWSVAQIVIFSVLRSHFPVFLVVSVAVYLGFGLLDKRIFHPKEEADGYLTFVVVFWLFLYALGFAYILQRYLRGKRNYPEK